MSTGLENELLSGEAEALPYEEVETDPANHNNNGQYGWVELDGKQCTNDYTSESYGQQYCVGDTYTDPNGGTQTIRAITMTGLDLAPNQWDAEETYADVGEKLGMSMEEWTEFSAEIQELNGNVDALKGNMFGPTEQERGRLGIRISNENPDWSEAEVMAEADRLLEEKWMTSEAYAEAAAAETALFAKYGITKPNPGVYGTGTWIDEDGKYFRFESSSGNLWQTSQDDGILDVVVPIGIGIGIGAITGGLGGALGTGSLGSIAGGAVNSVLGSAIGQVAMTGSLDPSSLLQAAVLGGIGGLAGAAVDGKLPPGMDEAVWDMADTLGISYGEVVDIIEGVATGAISGEGLEGIVAGAASSWTSSQLEGWVRDNYGDTVDVDDWFKDGESHIPVDALSPIIKGTVEAAINGGMSAEDAIGMAWDYFSEGGDVDFMLPDDFKDMVGGWDIPGFDINWPDIDLPGFDIDLPDVDIDLPDIDIDLPDLDIDLPDWNIGDPCSDEEGNEGFLNASGICDIEVDLPDVDIDLPDIDLPDVDVELPEVDVLDCMEGWEWSDLYEECVELPEVEVPDVELPEVDVLDCMQGWEWSDLYEECIEIPEVEIDLETPEFEVPEWELPEWETPELEFDEIDIDLPDLPDLPEPTAPAPKQASKHEFTPTKQFAYTDVKGYTAPAKRQTHDYIKGKGLLK